MGTSVEAAVISENKNIENLLFKRIGSLTEDIFDGLVTLYLSLKVRRYIRLKGATSRFVHLEKCSLNFSSW